LVRYVLFLRGLLSILLLEALGGLILLIGFSTPSTSDADPKIEFNFSLCLSWSIYGKALIVLEFLSIDPVA